MIPDFSADVEGTKYLAAYLTKKGFTNVTDMHGRHEEWDLEADWHGTTYTFECKMRKWDSDKFGDSICEPEKIYKCPNYKHAYLVNFFTDCFTIIPFTAEHTVQHMMCQRSELWNRTKKMKDILSFPNLPKYKHEYE